jgi:hypothetical protein
MFKYMTTEPCQRRALETDRNTVKASVPKNITKCRSRLDVVGAIARTADTPLSTCESTAWHVWSTTQVTRIAILSGNCLTWSLRDDGQISCSLHARAESRARAYWRGNEQLSIPNSLCTKTRRCLKSVKTRSTCLACTQARASLCRRFSEVQLCLRGWGAAPCTASQHTSLRLAAPRRHRSGLRAPAKLQGPRGAASKRAHTDATCDTRTEHAVQSLLVSNHVWYLCVLMCLTYFCDGSLCRSA